MEGKQVNPDLRNLIALQDLEIKIAVLQKQVSDIPPIRILEAEFLRIKTAHQERSRRKRTCEPAHN
jgi:hypothetical protein